MVRFLINRPIAVTMTYLALLILSLVASLLLPISLMPDVDIPRISVHISAEDKPARELENTLTRLFRQELMQVAHLENIKSETRDGSAVLQLSFNYGTNIDYAFIEVNEKIDHLMPELPGDQDRPTVIKASATDIPVFYLNLTLKSGEQGSETMQPESELFPVSTAFSDLSAFSEQVIRKRIEQLPQVALADASGQVFPELLIIPDIRKLDAAGISTEQIREALIRNNLNLGNLLIRDGQYQFNVRAGNKLTTKEEIEQVYLRQGERVYQLKDLARVIGHPQNRRGLVKSDGKDAVSMAIIKQSDARMRDLKKNLHQLVDQFRNDYPEIDFTVTRDQTQLLDYSINNLKQNLLYGFLLAFFVMFFFLKDFRSPILIGITLPVSLLISLLFFYLFHLSLNIISLSGLILGVGMMVDNAIIVIDNIHQFRGRGAGTDDACVNGTNEVFRPMLSSVLTTCAVFIPLIFIGGISGALFYDQAVAITISLLVSLAVSITLLPVYYRILYKKSGLSGASSWLARINTFDYFRLYQAGLHFTLRKQPFVWILVALMLAGTIILFSSLKKERMPVVARNEVVLRLDWNEPVNLEENSRRMEDLVKSAGDGVEQYTGFAGEQQFLFDHSAPGSGAEALLYMKAMDPETLNRLIEQIERQLEGHYPNALYKFEEAGNIFDLLFGGEEATLEARLHAIHQSGIKEGEKLQKITSELQKELSAYPLEPFSWKEQRVLEVDPMLLLLYDISYNQVLQALQMSFRENEVLVITQNQSFLPVVLGKDPQSLNGILSELSVTNSKGQRIRLSSLIRQYSESDLKTIVAGEEGVYYPLALKIPDRKVPVVMDQIRTIVRENGDYDVSFTGSWFSNRELIKKMALILVVSLLLLYFILASQFESFVLPLIVLLEVPVDIFGALLFLKIAGAGINLMSLIGIIVMSGIVINDSILKIDTINKLREQGYHLLRAVLEAGHRRLVPILMTSITTILAMVPFLFTKGMGSDLQRPLALSVIGGMLVGTMVSLFFIPLLYYYLEKRGAGKRSGNPLRS